jgi:hypothetical protein
MRTKRDSWALGIRLLWPVAFVLLFLAPGRVYGQGSVTGKIIGTAVDQSKAEVPGVAIVLRNTQTNMTRSTVTSELGAYEFLDVPVGIYELSAEKEGFVKGVAQVQVTVQSTVVVNLPLKVGSVSQEVMVSGQAEILNTTDATLSGFVDNQKVNELPLNGRSFVDLIGLQPGATPPIVTGGGRTSATRNAGGFVNGSDDFYNDFTIDGGDFNDIVVPDSLINKALIGSGVPPDAIGEFRVITANGDAESGTVAGAHINVVTKSGTNQIHGAVWEFLRDNVFDARNFFDPKNTLPFRLNQFGAVAGGPIRKDKNFFFGSYEGYRQSLQETTVAVVPTPLLVNAMPGGPSFGNLKELFQAYYPAPDPGFSPTALVAPLRTSVDASNHRQSFLIRSDNQLTSKDSLSGRIIFNNAIGPPGVLLSTGIAGGNIGFGWRTINPQITYTRMISPRTVNEFRINYNRSRLSVSFDEPSAAVVPLGFSRNAADANGLPFLIPAGTGLTIMGQFLGIPEGRVADVYQFSDTLTMTRGRHTLKTGFNIFRYQVNSFNTGDTPRAQVIFIGFGPPFDNSSFGLTTGNFFQQTQTFNLLPLNSSHRYDRFSHFAGFVQDAFQVRRNLTFDYGLRYELSTLPNEKNGIQNNLYQLDSSGQPIANANISDITRVGLFKPQNLSFAKLNKLNFAPRLGVAWSPFGSRIVVRAAYGIFWQRPDLFFFNDGTANPPFSIPTNLTGQTFGTHANPNNFLNQAINASVYNPGNRATYVQQYNLSLQLKVDATSYFQVGYVGSHTVRSNINSEPNLGGAFAGARPNPKFGLINLDTNEGNSHYNSLQVEFNRRLSKGLSWQSSYTYSKNIGLAEAGSTPTNLQNFSVDRGPMDADLRHMFITNVLYTLPWGPGKSMFTDGLSSKILGDWSLSGILIAHSGQTFSILAGSDVNGDGNNTDRAKILPGATLAQLKNSSGDKTQFLRPQSQVLNVLLSPTNGTLLGRNNMTGPRAVNLDFGLQKRIAVTERMHFEFRAEFFNIFNHTDLGNPDNTLTSPTFGRIFSTSLNSRQIQFGFKFYF